MATSTITAFTITKNVANAEVTLDYTVNFDAFDQASNLGYTESFKLRGDDIGQDGDDGVPGDDPVSFVHLFISPTRSNGQVSIMRNRAFSIPWADLNEDSALGSALANDDEIRAVVTLVPLLPVTTENESSALVVTAP